MSMMAGDNNDPAAYLRALQPDGHRRILAKVEALRAHYVPSDRDKEFKALLQTLIDNAAARRNPALPHAANNRRDGMGIMVTGPSGAGKSRLIQQAFVGNPAFPNYGEADAAWCPLISIGAPAPCNLLQLAIRFLIKLGYEPGRLLRENQAWMRVRVQLREQRILFLAIDDFQHITHQLSAEEIQKVRDTLKDLMTDMDWPVSLVLSGMPDLVPFAKHDRQLRRRLRYQKLEPVSPRADRKFLDDNIRAYVEMAGLTMEIDDEFGLAGRLAHAASYQKGLALEILVDAIENALWRGEKAVIRDDFADAYAARNLMPDDQNIFIASAWDTIDTSLIRPKAEDPEDDHGGNGNKNGKKS